MTTQVAKRSRGQSLVIVNHHTGRMPVPPPGAYVGYFQNQYGEQWIYIHDLAVGAPMLHGGDIEWEDKRQVEAPGTVPDLILDPSEAGWLRACWAASLRWARARNNDPPLS
jgi:hypothetical protein